VASSLEPAQCLPEHLVTGNRIHLLLSNRLDEEPEVEAAWRDEVRRRLEAYRAGEEATVSREAVVREARSRYRA
jgi:putative addiction module component (TIGR02574 family)